jgi:S1-C subfamily serine protease
VFTSKAITLLSAATGGVAAALVIALANPFSSPTRTTTVLARQSGGTAFASQLTATTSLTPREVYERDAHGVVAIRASSGGASTGSAYSPFGSSEQSTAKTDTGTGIELNDAGLIVTNEHVIEGAGSITVSLEGSSEHTIRASVVAEDKPSDLALLKIDPSGLTLHPLELADSASTQVGDSVDAIGNPYGLNWTLTTGVVSALNRQITAPDGGTISGVIQTDAALNPGNSGGPLIDTAGEVIGINSQIISGSSSASGTGGSSGVGFAIPSDTVKAFVQRSGDSASPT